MGPRLVAEGGVGRTTLLRLVNIGNAEEEVLPVVVAPINVEFPNVYITELAEVLSDGDGVVLDNELLRVAAEAGTDAVDELALL